jgi:hypothetical protein
MILYKIIFIYALKTISKCFQSCVTVFPTEFKIPLMYEHLLMYLKKGNLLGKCGITEYMLLLHEAIFLATCIAILLLRDVKLASTSLHQILL